MMVALSWYLLIGLLVFLGFTVRLDGKKVVKEIIRKKQ
jgi:hypothetical protein